MIVDIGMMKMSASKTIIRIYYSLVLFDDPGIIVDLYISEVGEIGDTLGDKIGYDHFEYAEFLVNDERRVLKFLFSLREYDLITFIKTPLEIDKQFKPYSISKNFSPLTQKYIEMILSGYAGEKYPELLI